LGFNVNRFVVSFFEKKLTKIDFSCRYQGMKPKFPRDERYFDAGTKLHVAFDLAYIK